MNRQAGEWLPATALTDSRIRAHCDAVVKAWSSRWFAEVVAEVKTLQPARREAAGVPAQQKPRVEFSPGFRAELSAEKSRALAWHALALQAQPPRANPLDDRLIQHFARRIVRDLAEALCPPLRDGANRFELDKGFEAPQSSIELTLALVGDGKPLLRLSMAVPAFVAYRKSLCPSRPRPSAPLVPLSRVIADIPIAFEASLGSARMSALDFQALAPGDVVVLERKAADPVLLRAAGAVVGGALLVRDGDALVLKAG